MDFLADYKIPQISAFRATLLSLSKDFGARHKRRPLATFLRLHDISVSTRIPDNSDGKKNP